MKRNRKQWELTVQNAKNCWTKAIAHYRLGVFHDNNGRESKAIPYYRRALRLGLNRKTKAKALAWLASSLYKTGKGKLALRYVKQAKKAARDAALRRFIEGLMKRIERTK